MNNLNWLLRAVRWVRNPPSAKQVVMLLAVIAFGLGVAGLEHFDLWPEWATVDNPRGVRLPR